MSLQAIRDNIYYASGYVRGHDLSLTGIYGSTVSKLTSILTLPLPLLSFLVLPVFGGQTTSINFVLFYLTWSTLVLTNDPLKIELYGTLVIRLFTFVLPGFISLGADLVVPSLAVGCKARGQKGMPGRLGVDKLSRMVGWAVFNTLAAIALQSALEIVCTRVLQTRSLLAVSTLVPLPWTIFKHLVVGYVLRGVMHYGIHRYVLHAPRTGGNLKTATMRLSRWHKDWAHCVPYTFTLHAAYDHPVNHLLAVWLPTYLPAVYLRMHVLTWLLFLCLTSLETTFIYSGYSTSGLVPSSIVLPGMARRVDAHFKTMGKGNYGHLGLLDWMCDTQCSTRESGFEEDVQEEAEKHQVRRRVSDAVDDAAGLVDDARKRFGKGRRGDDRDSDIEEEDEAEGAGKGKQSTSRRAKAKAKD